MYLCPNIMLLITFTMCTPAHHDAPVIMSLSSLLNIRVHKYNQMNVLSHLLSREYVCRTNIIFAFTYSLYYMRCTAFPFLHFLAVHAMLYFIFHIFHYKFDDSLVTCTHTHTHCMQVILARHCGLNVCACSIVVNYAAGMTDQHITHEVCICRVVFIVLIFRVPS